MEGSENIIRFRINHIQWRCDEKCTGSKWGQEEKHGKNICHTYYNLFYCVYILHVYDQSIYILTINFCKNTK